MVGSGRIEKSGIKCLIKIRPPERSQVKKANPVASVGLANSSNTRLGKSTYRKRVWLATLSAVKTGTNGAYEGWLFLGTETR